ncbi:LPD1 domain-containing protein [Bacillus salitolerans]|uniref:LPD1 domain-containing protein n=1 Tax=Bacillus salitolerans TaxID=1437434 RepID=A0ABW4LMQ4_9BACI
MLEQQISFFNETDSIYGLDNEQSVDIRTEKQANKKYSYDVGEKIGMAQKDIHQLRKQFQNENNMDTLSEIEQLDQSIAADLVTKNELFSSFNLEKEKENGTLPDVARFKQLLIQRIDGAPTEDSMEARRIYFTASKELLKRLDTIKSWDDVQTFIKDVGLAIRYWDSDSTYVLKRIHELEKEIGSVDIDSKEYQIAAVRLRRSRNALFGITEGQTYRFDCLGKSFCKFFSDSKSADSLLKNAQKIKSWDDLLAPKKSEKKKASSKPAWERKLPDRPDRKGGRYSFVESPEDLMTVFNLRAVEFGHYVEDIKGKEHLFRCSEALQDLSDVLNVSDRALSLRGELALAFGSRGKGGRALAHYEPLSKVINFTKNKGVLGVTAHEWFHSLDHFLFNLSHDFKNGKRGYLSEEDAIGASIDPLIVCAMNDLLHEINEGNSIATFPNDNKEGASWRIGSITKNAYKAANGDLLQMMKDYKEKLDKQYSYHLSMSFYANREDEKEKLNKRKLRELKKFGQAIAWLHEQETGNRVEEIPYPANRSQFLEQAIFLDKGKYGKYWSSAVELTARAFESWVQDKLENDQRMNDYLVCGTKDSIAYPIGEERERIHARMDTLMKLVASLLED